MFFFYLDAFLMTVLCFVEAGLVALLLFPIYRHVISKVNKLGWVVLLSFLFVILLILCWFGLGILSALLIRG